MGEFLVITIELLTAADVLKILGDPENLYWEESPHHLDVLARWLPQKGFQILPKFFDMDYQPGTVGDEGDRLVKKVHGCVLRSQDGGKPVSIWNSQVLELPEMRVELKRIVEEDVLDMSFEEEVVRAMEAVHGKAHYTLDAQNLRADNDNLKGLGEILLKLSDCIEQVKQAKGMPPFFEFYIP